jgi:hypothetical protein
MKIHAFWVALVMFTMTCCEFFLNRTHNPAFSLSVQFIGTATMFLPLLVEQVKDFL